MMHGDPRQREARLTEVVEILGREAAPEDRELLLELVRVVFPGLPARVALDLPAAAVAARLALHFRFVAREMPPAHQLFKGLPGIHVRVRNPGEEEARRLGGGAGLPMETTLVETHTPDRPFIFESLKNYLQKQGLRVFTAIHPVFSVRRQWERVAWVGGAHEEGSKESYTCFQIEAIDSRERLRRTEHEIHSLLKAVFVAVDDFADMGRACRELLPRLRSRKGEAGELASARSFLEWLLDDNYIFMGIVSYRPDRDGRLVRFDEGASGVFTDPALLPVVFPGVVEHVETHLEPAPGDERIVDLDFCTSATAIYHLDPIEDLTVREWGEDGRLAGLTLLLGRFARGAFAQRADRIPVLKEKHDWLLERSGVLPGSHTWREIRAVFNQFPKTELFYADVADLQTVIERVVHVTSDEELVVHLRRGVGYEALYVAFSRLRYSYQGGQALRRAVESEFGTAANVTVFDCGPLTMFIFYFESGRLERPLDVDEVQRLAAPLTTSWEDQAAAALERSFGESRGRSLFRRFVTPETRSGLYREATPPDQVPADVERFEALEGRLELRVTPKAAELASLSLYSVRPLDLTEILKTLQNLGLTVSDELRIAIELPEGRRCVLYRFELEAPAERLAALTADQARFVDALRALDEERATDDPLNGLILSAGLLWRDVELLRTLRNHLLQIRSHWNADTVNGVLVRNSPAAGALVKAFAARFDPGLAGDRAAAVQDADAGFAQALEAVRNLAEDEVLRALFNLVKAALRTNVWQRPLRPVFAVKVDSQQVEGMPSPRPMVEIYVHSRRLEGIHLRGGKVARGGIRWSDRHDDFRTEILGLMKTQMVKNSVIVPVGSKGGFVLKGELPGRPALDEYLIDRYREYVSALLDVTDNRTDGTVIHPPEVVRRDGDDPYLVVAADKGTAHLSDTANSVSAQYGFWLGDAFASGGSAGYDHKKMGITARGTWECVKHHFRNLGRDIQKEPFTCVGIGDMSGDVFGNGVLLSPVTRVVAAFDHRHIFLDPDPDPARSLAERQRLFDLPRSSWRDYDASAISRGGGVFDRSAKSIALSPEARRALGTEKAALSGEELIRAILTAPVDLLYNGGIGTYVKSTDQENAEVGDRANDRVRVNGREVRAKVIGEGGNLGLTQKGRLEYWAAGGLVNTDAIDNSGGVDTSDHEVNIKILLDLLVKRGTVKGRAERNRILAEMTDEVAGLVLADNAGQALALTLDEKRSARRYEEFVTLVDDMAGAGLLNRQDESVPSREGLLASPLRERGLPRPLLCVLLGYSKMSGFQLLLETDFPDGEAGRPFLDSYFPRLLRERFASHFQEHVLRREIIATGAVNYLVNRGGIGLLPRLTGGARVHLGEAVAAWIEVDREAEAERLRADLLCAGRPAAEEQAALLALEDGLEAAAVERLSGGKPSGASKAVQQLRKQLSL
ncbi:MAG TPA: NAD-glutamate dehydrogenase domain-containing protein [Vicinamibacteria bacterium]|nr:NAD-glutamate dehydrogenase domain-containing protein [Vicinamibacteria bacterium]